MKYTVIGASMTMEGNRITSVSVDTDEYRDIDPERAQHYIDRGFPPVRALAACMASRHDHDREDEALMLYGA